MDDELLLDFANEVALIEQNIEQAKQRVAMHSERLEAWNNRLNRLCKVHSIIKNVEGMDVKTEVM